MTEIADDWAEVEVEDQAKRHYFQSHTCAGYSARVTITWDIPENVDETVIRHRIADAEDIADDIMRFAAGKTRDMVQAMRGMSNTPHVRQPDGGAK